MGVVVYGIDPFASSPSSLTLLKALLDVGFKKHQIRYEADSNKIEDADYVLSFGAGAFRELTGIEESLSKYAGSLCSKIDSDAFVMPTYSPGYLFHNPSRKTEWEEQLRLFYAVISIDAEGVMP